MIRLGLDLDGVLFDFISAYNAVALQLFNITLPSYAREIYPTTWDHALQFLSPEQDREVWQYINQSPTFWADMEPYPWAFDIADWVFYVSEQKDQKVELYFITCRKGNNVKLQTECSLERIGFYTPTVLITPHWHNKRDIVNGLGLDIMIDDKPEILTHLMQKAKKTRTIKMQQPWNSDAPGEPVYDLVEFLQNL